MFIEFIGTAINMLPDIETKKFVAVGTSFYCWQHVAVNGDRAVV